MAAPAVPTYTSYAPQAYPSPSYVQPIVPRPRVKAKTLATADNGIYQQFNKESFV
eukprot:NODE_7292_length_463_cov_42.157005_g6463_i0.p2 GENE.NODE_7292_length_463_cov_42.157005_g6463_i0~~NODE_7292_length_463_cov_42.157005_g6463_i0.p2  ORF type:complete len:55 (+),score=1.40 NODE_7292_length_463_cov_42.157005_g6463_i0:205-369(+)